MGETTVPLRDDDATGSQVPRNAFHRTLVCLSYAGAPVCEPDLFSRACVEVYETSNQFEFGYQFTQIFEPGVLRELALLESVPSAELEMLDHRPSKAMQDLRGLLDARDELSVVERINLASALISVSRFDAAERACPATVATPRERFELAWIDFLISNRRDDGATSAGAFSRMIGAISEGGAPPGRVVDACTQGVVWYMKRREIEDAQYRWCLEMGTDLVRKKIGLGSGTISSWYRGLAMVPAGERNPEQTRLYMRRAYEYANQVESEVDGYGALNALKTYYESSIKEFVYVRPNLELAEESGLALIALDKHWSPSFSELAHAYEVFGQAEKAADYFEQAVAMGPPYFGHHLLSAARARARLDDAETALHHYVTLIDLSPVPSPTVCREALDLAARSGHAMRGHLLEVVKRVSMVEARP